MTERAEMEAAIDEQRADLRRRRQRAVELVALFDALADELPELMAIERSWPVQVGRVRMLKRSLERLIVVIGVRERKLARIRRGVPSLAGPPPAPPAGSHPPALGVLGGSSGRSVGGAL